MEKQTSAGPTRILGHVTLIMVVPTLGGVVAGVVLDAMLGTSPIFVLVGLAVGSLGSALGIWLYIRAHAPRESADVRYQQRDDA